MNVSTKPLHAGKILPVKKCLAVFVSCLFCGIQNEALIVRLGETAAELALQKSHVNPFNPTGKPMKGWVLVEQPAIQSDRDLNKWLEQARHFTQTLPAK
jgi:hypothetical protein